MSQKNLGPPSSKKQAKKGSYCVCIMPGLDKGYKRNQINQFEKQICITRIANEQFMIRSTKFL